MQDKKLNSTLLITILVLYFGACGGLWYIGFWSIYNINFLQYIGITDIIKDFTFPFITSSGVFLLSFLFMTFSNYHDRVNDPESVIFGKGRNSKTGVYLNKYVKFIISLYTLGIMVFTIWGGIIKWLLIPFLISTPLAVFLTNHNVLSKTIINPDIRASVINFIIVLPIVSFCFSKKQSIDIYQNLSYKTINTIQISNTNSKNQTRNLVGLKYLGSTTDKIFLTNHDNSKTTILNMKNVDFITYKSHKTSKTK